MVKMWTCDWGSFVIPDDVPMIKARKDGWFDHRRKFTPDLKIYFSDMTERFRDNKPILTWGEWAVGRNA